MLESGGKMLETRERDDAPGGTQTIRRACEVVRVVAQLQRTGANLTRVARATGLKTSTAYRILRALTQEQMLRYDRAKRAYALGPLAFELGLAVAPEAQVPPVWRDVVDRIARETRLTTYLVARSINDGVFLACVEGSTALRAVPMQVGQRLPLGVGASSLAILATLGDAEVERITAAHKTRLNVFPTGKPRMDRIRRWVERTREQGYAVSEGTVVPGVTGVGVAILPHEAPTELAISVSAVTSTLRPGEVAEIAALLARAISERRR
jgi:DNA-binding IclR family transcriptional regulator